MSESSEPTYVTQSAWLRPSGRADAIDEIADHFERPVVAEAAEQTSDAEVRLDRWSVEPGPEAFWLTIESQRSAPVWKAAHSFVPRTIERRAG